MAPSSDDLAAFDHLRGDAPRALRLWETEAATALGRRSASGVAFDTGGAAAAPDGARFVVRMRRSLERLSAALQAAGAR